MLPTEKEAREAIALWAKTVGWTMEAYSLAMQAIAEAIGNMSIAYRDLAEFATVDDETEQRLWTSYMQRFTRLAQSVRFWLC